MVGLSSELDVSGVNDGMTLMAHIFPHPLGFFFGIAFTAQGSSSVLDKALVSERGGTDLTQEAVGMPAVVHGLDDSPHDKLPAFSAAWCKENMKVVLTVFSTLKLIKHSLRKWLEALSTDKTLGVPHLSVGVDDFLIGAESFVTSVTQRPITIRHVATVQRVHPLHAVYRIMTVLKMQPPPLK